MRRTQDVRTPAERCAVVAAGMLAAFCLSFSFPATATEPTSADVQAKELGRVEKAVRDSRARERELKRQAEALAKELGALKRRLARAARTAQEQEEQLSSDETALRTLQRDEGRLRKELERHRAELSRLLGALARLSRQRPVALIASPVSAVDGMRSTLLLSAAVPALRQKAQALQVKMTRLQQLRRAKKAAHGRIDVTRQALAGERSHIAVLLTETAQKRRALLDRAETESRRLAMLTQSARDLKELIAQIDKEDRVRTEREAAAAEPTAPTTDKGNAPAPAAKPQQSPGRRAYATLLNPKQPFSEARGRLSLPARGPIVRHFGERGSLGLVSKGITIRTRAGAQITAPYDGEVVFAGDFRGYGRLLIIAHGEGYHSLLAGMSRIHVVVGQLLLANEPVGEMGGDDNSAPTLYVELRHEGEAIDPAPWLAASIGKVDG